MSPRGNELKANLVAGNSLFQRQVQKAPTVRKKKIKIAAEEKDDGAQ
jgi:hypothetical protein